MVPASDVMVEAAEHAALYQMKGADAIQLAAAEASFRAMPRNAEFRFLCADRQLTRVAHHEGMHSGL